MMSICCIIGSGDPLIVILTGPHPAAFDLVIVTAENCFGDFILNFERKPPLVNKAPKRPESSSEVAGSSSHLTGPTPDVCTPKNK